jgi:inosine guanosine and xanthosine phosphorylase family
MTQGLPGPGDDLAARAAETVGTKTDLLPRVALVLGSGLGPALQEALTPDAVFAYPELPGFPATAVPGHEGTLTVGTLAGVPVLAFSGRFHLYEGHDPNVPALLPRLAQAMGVSTIILTAAVGGLSPDLAAGTVIVITDHMNFMGATPLQGWRTPDGTPAFVNTQDVYDTPLAELALVRAGALGIAAAPGVYAAMRGPAYETSAEVAFLGRAGGTVVGMSMVPEALPARALGLRVLGLCSLTNALGTHVSHDEVVRVSNETAVAVGRLLIDLLPRMEGV